MAEGSAGAERPRQRQADLAALVAFGAIVLALFVSRGVALVGSDTFFNLVLGRSIATRGLPETNTLTWLEHGAPWVDQQWLAHLAWFEIAQIGGFGLVLAVRVALFALTLALCVRAARAEGAPADRIALVGLAAAALILPHTVVRAQSFAEPLFAGLLGVLLRDARAPSPRVYWAVPILAWWSNVHGSVLLGLGLVVMSQVARLVARPRPSVLRGALLVAASACASFASPYGAKLLPYFRSTAGNARFSTFVEEWGPPSLRVVPDYFAVLAAAVGIAILGRRALRPFAGLALFALALLSATALRHGIFLGIALVALLPAPLDAALPPKVLRFRDFRVNIAAAAIVVAVAVAMLARVLPTADLRIAARWPRAAAAVAARAAGPSGRVFADDRHADWLLWCAPELEGRVAFDTRLELLSPADLDAVNAVQGGDPAPLADYDVALATRERPGVEAAARRAGWTKTEGTDGADVYTRATPREGTEAQ
ncbi:MAG TPA: hypothetical protein VGI39_35860 [Polyangiaceae bacterium]|jgi:hypothetical protein